MGYNYVNVVETTDHVYLRYQPDDTGTPAGELPFGRRLRAAAAIEGGHYGGDMPGNEWYPVLHKQVEGGNDVECFLAKGYARLIPAGSS